MKQQATVLLKKIVKPITPLFFLFNRCRSLYRRHKYGLRAFPGIEGHVHYDDQALVNNDYGHYREVGLSALENIDAVLRAAGRSPEDIRTLLDFPCGYGRVLRNLKADFPHAHIDACDLMTGAVRFCNEEFGAGAVPSRTDIDAVAFPNLYGLIWTGSLLTHLDRGGFEAYFRKIHELLAPGGIAVFTTHGPSVLDRLDTYGLGSVNREAVENILADHGFYYSAYPGEKHYGISVSPRKFILDCIEKQSGDGLELIYFGEKGWDDHQDVGAVKKV